MRIAGWLSAGAALLAMALLVPTALAGSGSSQTVRFANSVPPLLNPTTITVQGQAIAEGCQYSGSIVVHPGQTAVEQDEVSENPSTCTMTLVQGTPANVPGAEANPAGWSSVTGSSKASGPTATHAVRRTSSVARALSTHSAGYSKTRFEDPVGIDVNSVKNSVDWTWNGSTVSAATCSYNYGWLSGDGWGLHENNFTCLYNSGPTQVDSSSYVHYKNGIFCVGFDTDVYYDRNHGIGRANGDLVGTWNTSKSGPCSGLLSVHNQVVRTLN